MTDVPVPSEDDLQRSPQQDPEIHRQTSAVLQDAVNVVVARHAGGSEADALDTLAEAVAARGLPPQPDRWMDAVASAAVAGHAYVVNEQAMRDTGVESEALQEQQHDPR